MTVVGAGDVKLRGRKVILRNVNLVPGLDANYFALKSLHQLSMQSNGMAHDLSTTSRP
jgi:hypothetical protein